MNDELVQEAMIAQVTNICEQDDRLQAAMLYGSFATGEGDQYSDIDIMMYFEDESLEEIDRENWLNQISPVGISYINEFGVLSVVFNNLIRGEFHFDPVSQMEKLVDFQGMVWFPSLDKTILVDKSGQLTTYVEQLIGTPPHRANPEAALNLSKSFINWFLFGINVFARGEIARSHEILYMVHEQLQRMIRLVEGSDAHWISPSKSLEEEISSEMYKRFQGCTSAVERYSLQRAYRACLIFGKELMVEMADQCSLSLPEELIEHVSKRFSEQVRMDLQ